MEGVTGTASQNLTPTIPLRHQARNQMVYAAGMVYSIGGLTSATTGTQAVDTFIPAPIPPHTVGYVSAGDEIYLNSGAVVGSEGLSPGQLLTVNTSGLLQTTGDFAGGFIVKK